MKNSVLVIILILGILILGFLFVIGKNKSVEPTYVPSTEEVTENNNQSSNNTQEAAQSESDCKPEDLPSIKLIYPNGGEIFTTNQKINIKWATCNISNDSKIFIGLSAGNIQKVDGPSDDIGGFGWSIGYYTNDGNETINLSDTFNSPEPPNPGSWFRIEAIPQDFDDNEVFDVSDNMFTINK